MNTVDNEIARLFKDVENAKTLHRLEQVRMELAFSGLPASDADAELAAAFGDSAGDA